MKKITIVLFLLFSTILFAQTTYVPDDNFEQALIDLGYDDVLDDYVLTENIEGVTSLDVSYSYISDLTGIEDFTALTDLNCSNNQLTNIDLSQNIALAYLSCNLNNLTHFNVSQNIALTDLFCMGNSLSSLDISQNIDLVNLYCSVNYITSLDVSQNQNLTDLHCWVNQLSILDVTQNSELFELDCRANLLTSIDIRNGNNSNISNHKFQTVSNPNLTCILVDDAAWSAENWTNIDPTSTFVETQEQCDALGVDEVILSEGLLVYPNPTQDLINVETTDLTDKNYIIYDIYGSISKQGVLNDDQIDISALKAGIYLLELGDTITKIVKL